LRPCPPPSAIPPVPRSKSSTKRIGIRHIYAFVWSNPAGLWSLAGIY
jgi:hypothetical protein